MCCPFVEGYAFIGECAASVLRAFPEPV